MTTDSGLVARNVALAPFARIGRWAGRPCGVLALLFTALACAPLSGEREPLPRHPFPRWVEQLEVGETRTRGVRDRFGEPDSVAQSPYGGTVYRYRFAEIHWPDDDPDRPVVGADGSVGPRPDTKLEAVGASIAAFGRWLDWLMFYPPRQSRPAPRRSLPATIHDLELDFDVEGRLVGYRYQPRAGRTPVSLRG